DGTHVVYVADQLTDGVPELFCAPIDGSTPAARVSGPMVAGGGVRVDSSCRPPFAITPDGTQVVYVADQDTDDVFELYRAPLPGGGASGKINGGLVAGGDVGGGTTAPVSGRTAFQLSAASTQVVFLADAAADEVNELYSAPLDGSAAPVRISAPL